MTPRDSISLLRAITIVLSMSIACFTLPAHATSKEACQRYARRAIDQYQIMNNRPKCRIKMNARWQPNYQNHYGWCLSAPVAWLNSEEKTRDDHLYRCGGQIRFDEGTNLNPASDAP
jgi:hypothetical protein